MNQPLSTTEVADSSPASGDDFARLKADYTRLLDQQSRIMELLGSTDARHLIHDLRNILNERELLRALVDLQG